MSRSLIVSDGDSFEIVALTPRQNRNRDLVGFGSRQDKDHIGRRLFQRFQKRIKSSDGKHMHLIDNVDLVFSCGGRIGDLLPDLTDVVHTVVGCGIDLDDVHGSARSDGLAGRTFPAGISVHGMLTVDGLCQNLGYALSFRYLWFHKKDRRGQYGPP